MLGSEVSKNKLNSFGSNLNLIELSLTSIFLVLVIFSEISLLNLLVSIPTVARDIKKMIIKKIDNKIKLVIIFFYHLFFIPSSIN